MSAKEKMPKKERVPLEMLNRFNAARAEYLETARAADQRIKEFRAECQRGVDEAGAAVEKVSAEISAAMKLDHAAGDKIDPSTGIVKRGGAK